MTGAIRHRLAVGIVGFWRHWRRGEEGRDGGQGRVEDRQRQEQGQTRPENKQPEPRRSPAKPKAECRCGRFSLVWAALRLPLPSSTSTSTFFSSSPAGYSLCASLNPSISVLPHRSHPIAVLQLVIAATPLNHSDKPRTRTDEEDRREPSCHRSYRSPGTALRIELSQILSCRFVRRIHPADTAQKWGSRAAADGSVTSNCRIYPIGHYAARRRRR